MEQRKKLTAPIVNHYIECLGRINYRLYNNDTTYDKESYKLIEQFYERIKYIQAEVKHGYRAWRLWFHADRGSIEDFADYDEWLDAGSIENREQFEKAWLDFFPDEEE